MSDINPDNSTKLLLAWQEVWCSRCCPPMDRLIKDRGGLNQPNLARHLEMCPWCREAALTFSSKGAESVREKIQGLTQQDRIPRPLPGMIFSLSPRLGSWGKGGRYICPPAVLVISGPEEDLVTVSQISEAALFSGRGDIFFENGLYGFAQSWNLYSIRPADFFLFLGRTDEAAVKAILDARSKAASEEGPEPGSIVWFYRQLELEIGRGVSGRSCASCTEQSSKAFISPEQIAAELKRLQFHIADDIPAGTSAEQIILMAEPPEYILPLAAAGGSRGDRTAALLFTISRHGLLGVKTLPVVLSFSEYAGGVFRIAGRLAEPVPDAVLRAELTWILRMDTETGSLEPIPGMSGSKGTMFWAAFDIPSRQMVRREHIAIRIMAQIASEERI